MGWALLAAGAAFLAASAKEIGVSLALLLPAWHGFWRRGSPARPALSAATARLLLAAPAAALLAYLGLRYHALGGRLHQEPGLTKTINVLVDAPTWQHALGVVQLWGMYWAKSIWPAELSVNYSQRVYSCSPVASGMLVRRRISAKSPTRSGGTGSSIHRGR